MRSSSGPDPARAPPRVMASLAARNSPSTSVATTAGVALVAAGRTRRSASATMPSTVA